jgi:aspartate beta-hydroxylase
MNSADPAVKLIADAARARQAGDAAAESRALDAALALRPGDPRILNAQGMHALAARDFARARACFTNAARADPAEPALWINVATASRGLGDDESEQQAIEHVLDIDRQHFIAQLRMAELLARRGHSQSAAEYWSNVVRLALATQDRPPIVEDALGRGQAFLATHHATLSTAIDAALMPQIEALGPAARRFAACVDYSLGRRTIYQNQCAGVHFPFLPAEEFFNHAQFPWLPILEAQTDLITAEALALCAGNSGAIRPYVRMEKGLPDNKWSGLDHSLDWSACFLWEYGARNEPVCEACPITTKALTAIPQNHVPGKAPTAFFSILRPGAHIPPHTGVTNTRAIIHLPLVVPPACRFRVGGETREWQVGKAMAFDDTIEHEAWNDSESARIVLIFDVWNPYLTSEEQMLLSQLQAIQHH